MTEVSFSGKFNHLSSCYYGFMGHNYSISHCSNTVSSKIGSCLQKGAKMDQGIHTFCFD